MKVLHYIFFPEIIRKENNQILVKVNGLENYQEVDFNIFLCLSVLNTCNVLNEQTKESYLALLDDYLNNKVEDFPPFEYKGELADEYTKLAIQKNEITNSPDYQRHMTGNFNAYQFGDEIPESNENIKNIQAKAFELGQKMHKISEKIESEIRFNINTISWPRKQSGEFNYSIPATLIFRIFQYDEQKLPPLEKLAKSIVRKFEINKKFEFRDEDENEDVFYWNIFIEGDFSK